MRDAGRTPLREYAAVGDGRTVALVASDGALARLCLPDLDSPSAFGAIVDAAKGGSFVVAQRLHLVRHAGICPTPTCWRPR